MEIISEKMKTNKALLTGYIQSPGIEMMNLNTRPAVLILPGGFFQFCSEKEMEPVALAYVQQGFNAFVLRYTTIGNGTTENAFACACTDAEEAMAYLRANAAKLHIDPKKIAAVGFSTGGSVAAALGTMSKEKPNALVLGYAALYPEKEGMTADLIPDLTEDVDETTPPAFLFVAQDDEILSSAHTLRFAEALAKRQIPYECHVFSSGGHAMSLANETVAGIYGAVSKEAARWLPMSAAFLKNVWKKQPAEK